MSINFVKIVNLETPPAVETGRDNRKLTNRGGRYWHLADDRSRSSARNRPSLRLSVRIRVRASPIQPLMSSKQSFIVCLDLGKL